MFTINVPLCGSKLDLDRGMSSGSNIVERIDRFLSWPKLSVLGWQLVSFVFQEQCFLSIFLRYIIDAGGIEVSLLPGSACNGCQQEPIWNCYVVQCDACRIRLQDDCMHING